MFDVMFDLDGTLVDSARQCEAIVNAMRSERGLADPVAPVLARRYAGVAAPIMVPALLGPAAGDTDADVKEFRARYVDLVTPADALYPGVAHGLARLSERDGVRLSICTAKPQRLADRVLADTGIAGHFERVVGGDAVRACKPDRAHADAVIEPLGGRHADAVLVGDTVTDRKLAAAAGMAFIAVAWGYGTAAELGGPAVESFGALVELIEGRYL